MEKKRTNSGPFRKSTGKHSISALASPPAYCLRVATPNDDVRLPGGRDKGCFLHHDLSSIDNGYLSGLIFQQE
jgi:hypothetical protein